MSIDAASKRLAFVATCDICDRPQTFRAHDDYWHCRDDLRADACPYATCITRQRALAAALFSIFPRALVPTLKIHESSPTPDGVSLWLRRNCPDYVMSGYFPGRPFGAVVSGLRNEDLEAQTFADEEFDLVVHLDVMEHVFEPFQALREIRRTLRPGGVCAFAAPTYAERTDSEQVAFRENGGVRIVGEPEYHGNPQDSGGALVTWRYGYDLPRRISRETGFDVEVRRWQSARRAIMGPMTEVYILTK